MLGSLSNFKQLTVYCPVGSLVAPSNWLIFCAVADGSAISEVPVSMAARPTSTVRESLPRKAESRAISQYPFRVTGYQEISPV